MKTVIIKKMKFQGLKTHHLLLKGKLHLEIIILRKKPINKKILDVNIRF